MSRTVREVEVTGHVRQRVAGSFEIAIDREATLSPDLKTITAHRCYSILLSSTVGKSSVVFEMTPDQARQLAAELVEAADSWTEPMDVTS